MSQKKSILLKEISGKNSQDNNIIRENLLKYFTDRDCVTLVRPADKEEDINNLNNIPFENLKSSFQYNFMTLKNKVFKDSAPKKINGKKLNGPALVTLIETFVEAINSGAIPNISNAWDAVIEKDIKDYYDKAIGEYMTRLKTLKGVYDEEEIISLLGVKA